MNQNDTLRLAQEFLRRMASDAEPAEIAKLFGTLDEAAAKKAVEEAWFSGKRAKAMGLVDQTINRDKLESDIVAEAVKVFAESGYEGASIATVADNAGLSKQNLMYYFPTKQALYQRVLDDVLDEWLERPTQSCKGDLPK